MESVIYNLKLDFGWDLVKLISQIDRFDASWSAIEKKETNDGLKYLKTIATVSSVASSTRIEGSKMSNDEVNFLIDNLKISKLEDRDSQEVAGYFETMDIISASYQTIGITENSIKNLHNILLKHSKKDDWHKGNYKQHSNVVEARYADGTKQIVFQTTEPGYATEDAMRNLIDWYNTDNETHSLVKCAIFTYEFLSIHPFQDGNGRLSRLISSLLLLKNGYNWIQYISFENEIEKRKLDYYSVLRNCQANRPNENVSLWTDFFFDCIKTIQIKLMKKFEVGGEMEIKLQPREKTILSFIDANSGCKTGEIAAKLGIQIPTVRRVIQSLLQNNLIEKFGDGAGTNYAIK
jgi:Fic family protein